MKNKKLFKDKRQMIIYIVLFIIFILLFIYFGTLENKTKEISDSEKFGNEYKIVTKDNVFSYINAQDASAYVRTSNAIILFGIKNNANVGRYAKILNEVAKEVGIDRIFYYDITEDRENKNGTYESIVEYLKSYITVLDDGTKNIYAPTLLIKKHGVIAFYDDESALIKGEQTSNEYWDNYQENITRLTLKKALEDYVNEE